jgi:hypothetical protein
MSLQCPENETTENRFPRSYFSAEHVNFVLLNFQRNPTKRYTSFTKTERPLYGE